MDNAAKARELKARAAAARPPIEVGEVVTIPAAGWVQVNCSGAVESIWCPDHVASLSIGAKVVVHRGNGISLVVGSIPIPDVLDEPSGPPDALPADPDRGTMSFPAVDSGTFVTDWRFGEVTQGDGGLGDSHGSWFYHGTPGAALAGTTILGCRIHLCRRAGTVGVQTVHLWLHTSETMPLTDVTRTLGPTDITMDVGEVLDVTLPAAWGQAIVDTGCGIGVSGGTHTILHGVDTEPDSGLISLDWMA